METLFQIAIAVVGVALLSFVAGFILSFPGVFSKDALRRPRRLPVPPVESSDITQEGDYKDILKTPFWKTLVAFPFALMIGIIVFPALLAIAVSVTCAGYRYYRHLAYRILRRRARISAYPLSFAMGLRLYLPIFNCRVCSEPKHEKV